MVRSLNCVVMARLWHQRHSPCNREDGMNVLGLLVEGPGGDDYVVTTGPDRATGPRVFLIFPP